ncbi:MAG: EAL domain-containing protein [Betaproteobacteria bacterium]|nr:MAG: EAL domain-containing protein [Betaproteobacteria bacterium]
MGTRYPGIEAVSYARRIRASEKAAFEASVRNDVSVDPRGYPNFAIRPAGDRPEYVVVQYLEPMAGRETALGLDLRGDEVRLSALNHARDSDRITATGSIRLALAPNAPQGFAMRLPIYRKGRATGTVDQRREAFAGIVAAIFVMDDLMRGVLSESFLQTIHLRIHDAGFLDPLKGEPADEPAAENLLFDSDRLLSVSSVQEAAGEKALAGISSLASMEVGGRYWNLHFTAHPKFASLSDRWIPPAVLLGGIIISALLFALIRSLAGVGERATTLAANITADLRRSEARFRSLAELSSDWYWEQDRELRLSFHSMGFTQRSGTTSEKLLGKRRWEEPNRMPLGGSWEGHRATLEAHLPFRNFEYVRTGDDGARYFVSLSGLPVVDAAGQFAGYRGVGTNITERKGAELRLGMEHAVTRLLSEAKAPEKVMRKIIQTICEALGFACGARMLLNQDAQTMHCTETWSVPSAEIMEFIVAGRLSMRKDRMTGGLLRRVWGSAQPVWIADVAVEAGFDRAPFAAKAGLHAAFAYPILFGNEILGAMEFFCREIRQPDEVLLQSLRSIGAQIGQFMARSQAEERVHHLAHYDELTGLPNRSMFNQRLSHALAQARRSDNALAVLFIDLDRFKNINDTLGHEAGDAVLKEVALRLQSCLREVDTVGRLGGDEFVVLIEGLPEPLQVAAVAQKILAAVVKSIIIGAQEFNITTSIGISNYPDDSNDMQGLLKNADIAMYRAKAQGKNNYQFYSAQMNVHTIERLALESDLRHALERDEFLLHYQPKVDIASKRITGMEALLRWQRPGLGLVPPMQFIPLAEETGLIVPIGEWVLRTACAQNKAWREQGLPPLRVAVNLSARQFAHENLLHDVARVLRTTGMDASALELEITESMVMHDPERAVELLGKLKAMGIHLSIDDFGTGYSSLSYLKRFPLDSLKIDRSFIRDIPGDADDAAITRAIIAMAQSLRLTVIAEGVELEDQLTFLREHDCDEMQGYHFSKPLPGDEFLTLLRANPDR